MVENLKRGDVVVTSGGMIGKVERIMDNDKLEINISENVNVEIIKSTGIQGLLNTPEIKNKNNYLCYIFLELEFI